MPAYKRLRSPTALAPAVIPFRWNFDKPEQLPVAVHMAEPAEVYPQFQSDLRAAVVRMLRAAGDADWVFVGRSPESLMDYLAGATSGTAHAARVGWLNLSIKGEQVQTGRIGRLRPYLHAMRLDPQTLAQRLRPVALVDFMFGGDTFSFLLNLLYHWSIDTAADWPAAVRKLRLVGLQERPPRHRLTELRLPRWADRPRLRVVIVPGRLWSFCADTQPKSAASHTPDRWGEPEAARPPRQATRLAAAKRSLWVRHWSQGGAERRRLVRELATAGGLREAWLRRLALEIRGSPSNAQTAVDMCCAKGASGAHRHFGV